MSEKAKKRMENTLIGYGFIGLNLYALSCNLPMFGLGFGVVGLVFFTRAILIRPEK